MELITISEAAELANKSIQTIRRMIKKRKIQVKRQKTPQGFNYLVIKESLLDFASRYGQSFTDSADASAPMLTNQATDREHRSINQLDEEFIKNELERFNATMQKLIEQHSKDKENLFGLIKTFQDRATILEDQIKLLQSPKKSWWKIQLW